MMKKIVITGSNGLLGQKLVHLLKGRSDVQLIAVSKGVNRISDQEGYVYEHLDISKRDQVKKVFEKYLPDAVINTAAMTNVDQCEELKEECWKVNVEAVDFMVSALQELKEAHKGYDPQFVHLSTDFVFDGEAGPYKEDDIPNPLSYYALSKLESEKIVQASTLKWAIARTIIVYGVAEAMSRTNIVLWAREAMLKGQPLKIVNDQFRAPTLAEDLAMGCWLIIEKQATGIFHLSGKDIMSIVELVERVGKFLGCKTDIIEPVSSSTLNQKARRPPRTGFVLDKAITVLGYQPHSFEEGLKILEEQLNKA